MASKTEQYVHKPSMAHPPTIFKSGICKLAFLPGKSNAHLIYQVALHQAFREIGLILWSIILPIFPSICQQMLRWKTVSGLTHRDLHPRSPGRTIHGRPAADNRRSYLDVCEPPPLQCVGVTLVEKGCPKGISLLIANPDTISYKVINRTVDFHHSV